MKKEKIIETINELPAEVDLNDFFERLVFIDKVQKGLIQIENNETIPHNQVAESFEKKWKK